MGAIMAVGSLVKGGLTMAGALKGRSKVDNELRAATGEFDQARKKFKDFSFSNPWTQMENTMEDLTVSTQAAEFQAMQADQALAASLDTMLQAGGGAGSAQAIAQAALASQQGISASIQAQEQRNAMARAEGAMAVQKLQLQGEEDLQSQSYIQAGKNLNLATSRKLAADQAKQQNQDMFMSGLGTIGQGLFGGGVSGAKALAGMSADKITALTEAGIDIESLGSKQAGLFDFLKKKD